MSDPALEVVDVVKQFDSHRAVDRVSFAVPKGSFFSILGPSGCGKTTLLRMIAGFAEPDAGDIRVAGRSVLATPPNRRPVNMVFQHLALFPMMSVGDNIAYGLRRRGLARGEIAPRVAAILKRVGLPDVAERRIDQLSGGQKQRIAIARCLVLDPEVLVLDEPLGALDLKLREHMKVELKQLQAEIGTTFVYITHDQSEALVMSNRVAVMNKGRFEQVGAPQELYYRPATAFVAGFVGEANRWRGIARRIEGGVAEIEVEGGARVAAEAAPDVAVGARVAAFLRPESVAIARGEAPAAANRFQGRIESILFNGAASAAIVRPEAPLPPITVALPLSGALADLAPGEPVEIAWQAAQCRCFAEAAGA
jgi:spermidine/putrescine transport system ATP-binding protein